jgi:hypothetical protein
MSPGEDGQDEAMHEGPQEDGGVSKLLDCSPPAME